MDSQEIKAIVDSVEVHNFHHLCMQITVDKDGDVIIPEGQQQYSNRYKVLKSAEEIVTGKRNRI